MKETTIEKIGQNTKVTVRDGDTTLSQDITPDLVQDFVKELKVPEASAVRFLVVRAGAVLRNVADEEAGKQEFLTLVIEAAKNEERWAVDYLTAFTQQVLPGIIKVAKKARNKGQDEATAVSLALDTSMKDSQAFLAAARAAEEDSLSASQIVEIMLLGLQGVDPEEISSRYGIKK